MRKILHGHVLAVCNLYVLCMCVFHPPVRCVEKIFYILLVIGHMVICCFATQACLVNVFHKFGSASKSKGVIRGVIIVITADN